MGNGRGERRLMFCELPGFWSYAVRGGGALGGRERGGLSSTGRNHTGSCVKYLARSNLDACWCTCDAIRRTMSTITTWQNSKTLILSFQTVTNKNMYVAFVKSRNASVKSHSLAVTGFAKAFAFSRNNLRS